MKEKRERALEDPDLDRIFKEAYIETMEQAYHAERAKRTGDRIEAFTELFETELAGHDLSVDERGRLIEALKRRLKNAEAQHERWVERRDRKRKRALAAAAGVILLVTVVFFSTYRPFTPISSVENDLEFYIERVDAGYGEYAQKFYRLLDRFDRRLDDPTEERYRERMYDTLDLRFRELLTALQSGDLTLFDDARKWAKLFPERAERNTRKELVENAGVKGVGGALGNFIEKAGKFITKTANDAADWAEKNIGNERDEAPDGNPSE